MPTTRHRPTTARTVTALVAGLIGLTALAGPAVAATVAPDSAQPAPSPGPPDPPRPADRSPAPPPGPAPLAAGTPCTVTARACVDLESQRAWLITDGAVSRGPVPVASGGRGHETPVGHSLRVYRKSIDHRSQESRLPDGRPAPMPYAAFFDDGGIAFHSGALNRSSDGCVRLEPDDARAWFTHLNLGDQVQVVRGSEELAARDH